MVTGTGVVDANDKESKGVQITLTGESLVSLYVFSKTGAQGNYRIQLEISPDGGTSWVGCGEVLRGPGIVTCQVAATKAQAKVLNVQGEESEIVVHLVAI